MRGRRPLTHTRRCFFRPIIEIRISISLPRQSRFRRLFPSTISRVKAQRVSIASLWITSALADVNTLYFSTLPVPSPLPFVLNFHETALLLERVPDPRAGYIPLLSKQTVLPPLLLDLRPRSRSNNFSCVIPTIPRVPSLFSFSSQRPSEDQLRDCAFPVPPKLSLCAIPRARELFQVSRIPRPCSPACQRDDDCSPRPSRSTAAPKQLSNPYETNRFAYTGNAIPHEPNLQIGPEVRAEPVAACSARQLNLLQEATAPIAMAAASASTRQLGNPGLEFAPRL